MPSVLSSTADPLTTRPVRVLLDALESNRLSHSLIISGENREAVETTAHHLALKILNAPTNDPAALPRHPDFFPVRPAGKMRQIGAGAVRDLIRSVHHSSREGGAKTAILYDADRLNHASANIFLKTLEEPPADTTLMLLTTRPHFLLPTIRSRCLHFRLPPLQNAEDFPESLQSWLNDFTEWLDGFDSDFSSKSAVARQVLGAYGLLSRFSPLLEAVVAASWSEQKEELPEDMTDDEREALAQGLQTGLRARIFAAIEHRLRAFAQRRLTEPGGARALTNSVADLERVAGLLAVNLKEGPALEAFLLAALRHWGRR